MPYKSKAQQRAMHAKAERGEIDKKVVEEFDKETKKQKGGFKALPEKKKNGKDKDMKEKRAFIPGWGGGQIDVPLVPLGDDRTLGAELGYTWGLGAIPLPKAGLRVGSPKGGISVGTGYVTGDTGRPNEAGPHWNKERNIYQWLLDAVTSDAAKADDDDEPETTEDSADEAAVEEKTAAAAYHESLKRQQAGSRVLAKLANTYKGI